jgi:phosphosulfolactate synthase (CoM biosynthesis protein A)
LKSCLIFCLNIFAVTFRLQIFHDEFQCQMPERAAQPSMTGLSVMDKGLSIRGPKFYSVASPHVDIVKLGFGALLLLHKV